MIIDGHLVLDEFISEEADQEVIKKSEEWKSKHVRESRIQNTAGHFVRAI